MIGKPKLKKLPSVIIAEVDRTPELVCEASGWPAPRLSWWRNGSMIHDGDLGHSYIIRKTGGNLLSMRIIVVDGRHHGTYSYRADNVFGTSEKYVNIMVKSK